MRNLSLSKTTGFFAMHSTQLTGLTDHFESFFKPA
jgi:hypothetical protein